MEGGGSPAQSQEPEDLVSQGPVAEAISVHTHLTGPTGLQGRGPDVFFHYLLSGEYLFPQHHCRKMGR